MTTWTVEAESASQTVGLGAAASASAAAASATAAASSATAAAASAATLGTLSVTASGSTTSRTLPARFADRVNVLDFGATINDTTCTTAVQAAITACVASGKALYFPAGTYRVGKLTVSGALSIQGDGFDTTTIKNDTIASDTVFEIASASFQVQFRDVQINGMSRALYAVRFLDYAGGGTPYYKSLLMDRCKLFGGTTNQLYLGARRYLAYIRDSEIYGGTVACVCTTGADHRFVNCDIGGASDAALDLISTRSCTFTGCHFYSNAIGVRTDANCYRNIWLGGAVDTNTSDGMQLAGSQHSIAATKFAGNATGDATKADIYLNATKCVVTGATFVKGSGVTPPNYCVRVGASGTLAVFGSVSLAGSPEVPYTTSFTDTPAKVAVLDATSTPGMVTLGASGIDSTLRPFTDMLGTASKLQLATGGVGVGDITSVASYFHIGRSGGDMVQVVDAAGSAVNSGCIYRTSRGTLGTPLTVTSGDTLSRLDFRGHEGSAYVTGLRLSVVAAGTIATGIVPTRFLVSTQTTGSSTLTERLRVEHDGSLGLGGASFGSGAKVVFIADATTTPTTNPTGGGILYVESGALKYRGSGGTVTTIGPA